MMFSSVIPTLDMVVNGLFFLSLNSLMERVKLINTISVSDSLKIQIRYPQSNFVQMIKRYHTA